MRRCCTALIVTVLCISVAGTSSAESIGFNFTRSGVPLSVFSPTEDPFVGLYVGNSGDAGYTNVSTYGVYTYKGVILMAPQWCNLPYSGENVEYGAFWAQASVSSPADDTNIFKRSGAGGVGIEEPHDRGAFTLNVSNIPYARYDVYISALNAYTGHGTLSVSGGPTFNLSPVNPGSGGDNSWNTPIRITDTGPFGGVGEVSAGNWMVAEGLTAPSLDITFSTAGGWKGGIGSIQFVDASPPAQPTLKITAISMVGSNAVVEWPGSNSWSYTVEYTPSLAPLVPWSNLMGYGDAPGVDGPMSATDTNNPGTEGFYRVRMTR